MPRSNLTSDSDVTRCFPAWIDSVLKAFRREKRCVSEKSHNEEYRTFHILDVILLSESVWMKVTRTVSRCQQLLKSSISIFHLLWPDLQRPPGILHYHYHIPCCSTRWLTLSLSLSPSFPFSHSMSLPNYTAEWKSRAKNTLSWNSDRKTIDGFATLHTDYLFFHYFCLSSSPSIHPSILHSLSNHYAKTWTLSEYNANNF